MSEDKKFAVLAAVLFFIMGLSIHCAFFQKTSVILEDATFFKDEFLRLYNEAVEIITMSIKVGVEAEDGSVTVIYPHGAIVRLKEIKAEAEKLYQKLIEEIRDYDPSIDTLIAVIRKLVTI